MYLIKTTFIHVSKVVITIQISDYNVISPGSSLVKMVRLLSVELSTRMVPLPLPQFKNQAIMRVRLIAQNVLKT